MKVVFAAIASFVFSASLVADKAPNMIFVMLDDLGYSQIEAYARGLTVDDLDPKMIEHTDRLDYYEVDDAMEMVKRASPTLSRLADEGVTFTNAMATSNLCAPARIGVATGILQNRWGIYRNIDTEAVGLNPDTHLAERLQEAGYATAHIGKWHVGSRDHRMVHDALEKHGVTVKYPNYYQLERSHPKIFKELKNGGFEGSTSMKDHALNNGFNYYFGYNQWESPFYNATNVWEGFEHAGLIKEYNTDVFTDRALDFMSQSLDASKPFYVQLHYHAVHHPLRPKAPAQYQAPFDSQSEILNNFYAHIYAVDQSVKRVIEYLDTRDEAENTIIVFTSDNGGAVGNLSAIPGNAPYREHKGSMMLGGFKVPLFFSWPAGISEAQRSGQLVTTLDILPTLIDAGGGDLPKGLDGKSLLPWIKAKNDEQIHDFFAVGGIHARVWGFLGSTSFFKHNESREKAPAGFIIADNRYILRSVGPTVADLYRDEVDGKAAYIELFDYRKDPGETVT